MQQLLDTIAVSAKRMVTRPFVAPGEPRSTAPWDKPLSTPHPPFSFEGDCECPEECLRDHDAD
jgi:hypothetical protein